MTHLERRVIDLSYKLKLSHIGSCLTCLPTIVEIYANKKHDEKFVLSCGHSHLAHAIVMEECGIIESAEENIKKHGIHCERAGGCDCSTGSLGLGITIALGMALADRTKNVFCLISDGEAFEGTIWEALNTKEKYNVNNLIVYCNFNGYSAYDETKIETFRRLPGLIIVDNSQHWFIKQFKQEAHYRALTETDYEKIIR